MAIGVIAGRIALAGDSDGAPPAFEVHYAPEENLEAIDLSLSAK